MPNVTKTFVASASELQSSDLYMTIKATLFTVPSANLNGVRCTAGFMEEIVENQDKYIGLPLCADTVNLVSGRYKKLGHCYNPKTGTYSSSIIGSFYRFEKEELSDGEVALVGYARVMKRNKKVCKAIGELFAEGALKFSFEISCGTYETLEDDTILIDAADNNYIEGMCIVSFPACPEAVALDLVAEINGIGKEADVMNDVIESAAVETEVLENAPASDSTELNTEAGEPEVVVAEAEDCSEEEQESAEPEDMAAEMEPAAAPAEEADVESEAQNAEVYVTTETRICETVDMYDSETGVYVTETTSHEVRTNERVEDATLVVEVAEAETEEPKQVETAADETPAVVPDYVKVISELQASVDALRNELAELRAQRVVAEVKDDSAAAINPFVAEISAPKKYSLLESDKPSTSGNAYSLLEKA